MTPLALGQDRGSQEIPAIVVGRMNDSEELVVMFNVHSQRRGWETAEELRAMDRLVAENPGKSDAELAAELGMNTATFRDRRRVLGMGETVVAAIGRGEIDYYAALRTGEVTRTLAEKRPELTARLGGESEIRNRLLTKAKSRKGITRELENIRQDARDHEAVPDDVLETYIEQPQATLAEARGRAKSLAERRAVEDLVKQIHHLNSDLRIFDVDLYEAPNLNDLRRALSSLMEAAQGLEGRIVDVTIPRRPGERRAVRYRRLPSSRKHRLGLRCRVMHEPSPIARKTKTHALWSAESDAYLCDARPERPGRDPSHRAEPDTRSPHYVLSAVVGRSSPAESTSSSLDLDLGALAQTLARRPFLKGI